MQSYPTVLNPAVVLRQMLTDEMAQRPSGPPKQRSPQSLYQSIKRAITVWSTSPLKYPISLTHPTPTVSLINLPAEIHVIIIDFLDIVSLLQLHLTNKYFCSLIRREHIVAALYKIDDPSLQPRGTGKPLSVVVCYKCYMLRHGLHDFGRWHIQTGYRPEGLELWRPTCLVCSTPRSLEEMATDAAAAREARAAKIRQAAKSARKRVSPWSRKRRVMPSRLRQVIKGPVVDTSRQRLGMNGLEELSRPTWLAQGSPRELATDAKEASKAKIAKFRQEQRSEEKMKAVLAFRPAYVCNAILTRQGLTAI